MGSGQKAWAEELEEEAFNKKLKAFRSYTDTKVVNVIDGVLEDLIRLKSRDLRLTVSEHNIIDSSIKTLRSLIKVND